MAAEVKICGLTSPTDAALAASLGAARLGVIFAGGPRQVDVQTAREIVSAAAGVPVIAVVGRGTADEHFELVAKTGVSGLQLHGGGSDMLARKLRDAGIEVWRVAAINPEAGVEAEVRRHRASASVVLVEPRQGGRSGGLGLGLDHASALVARRELRSERMALAGGLNADNVALAIGRVGPDLVDVSSGVEFAPGRKDPTHLARFMEAARDARSPD